MFKWVLGWNKLHFLILSFTDEYSSDPYVEYVGSNGIEKGLKCAICQVCSYSGLALYNTPYMWQTQIAKNPAPFWNLLCISFYFHFPIFFEKGYFLLFTISSLYVETWLYNTQYHLNIFYFIEKTAWTYWIQSYTPKIGQRHFILS